MKRAFSLVEVVIALGIFSVAIVGIIGLFTVGIRTGSESSETTAAANLASHLLNQRRLFPKNPAGDTALASFALPSLEATKTNLDAGRAEPPVYVAADGSVSTPDKAEYGLVYDIRRQSRSSNVYLMLYWPPQAPLQNAMGRFEISTEIPVP